jgi:ATP-dependent protease HslVU (ClpYQ) ATPase subunit
VKKVKGGFPMPLQEERLDILEYNLKQFKTETIKAYGEMAVELTMVKGLTEDAVKRLASLKVQIDQRFERVDARLDGMDAHLESMDSHFEHVDTRLDKVDAHLESVDGRLGRLEILLGQVLARLPEKP